jgi:hypothetical protein
MKDLINSQNHLILKSRAIFLKYGPYIVACFLILPFLYYLYAIKTYVPGTDETYQIEAAIRILNGFGNTFSWTLDNDLSISNFSFQNAWPIGYSSLLASLLFIGLPLQYALKLLKISILLTSIFTWIRLSDYYIKNIWFKIMFSGFASVYIVKYSSSVTDMVIVMFLSIFSILLLVRNDSETSNRLSVLQNIMISPIMIGLLIGIMILFKFSGIFLAAGCAFWILLMIDSTRKNSISNLIKYLIPVTIFIAFTLAFQQHQNNIAYAIENSEFITNIHFFYDGWLDDIFNSVFQSTYLEPLMDKVITDTSENFLLVVTFMKLMFFISYFTILFLLNIKGGKFQKLSLWIIINHLILTIFLKVVSSLFFEDVSQWLPIKEGRYYWPLFLFFPMGMLTILEPKWNILSTVYKATITLGIMISIFIGICLYSDYKYDQYSELNAEMPLLKLELEKLIRKDTNPIVFVDEINWKLYPDRGNYNVFFQLPRNTTNYYFSKETIVIMLTSSNKYLPRGHDTKIDDDNIIQKMAKVRHFNRIKVGKFTTIFWKEYPPGSSFN